MVSAQDPGLAMDGVCEQIIANGTTVDVGQAAYSSGVENVTTQMCRHAGEYLLGRQKWLDSRTAQDRFDKGKLGSTHGIMLAMLNAKIFKGAWNDTGVDMMDTRPHQCLCLAEPLPGRLHSLSLHVAADEGSVRIHSGPKIQINGDFDFSQFFL